MRTSRLLLLLTAVLVVVASIVGALMVSDSHIVLPIAVAFSSLSIITIIVRMLAGFGEDTYYE